MSLVGVLEQAVFEMARGDGLEAEVTRLVQEEREAAEEERRAAEAELRVAGTGRG